MSLKIALRDDDISYFTAPAMLEAIYRDIWDRVPVSLSVIPFVKPQHGLAPASFFGDEKLYPVGDNEQLIAFLRQKITEGRVHIMLHGYSHADTAGGYECERGMGLTEKVRAGKQYLEALLGQPIRVFVPPHNSMLSREGLYALEANGLDLLIAYRRFPKSFHPARLSDYVSAGRLVGFHLRYGWRSIYPYPLHCRRHDQVYCYTLNTADQVQRVQSAVEHLRLLPGARLCIATHHRTIDTATVQALHRLLRTLTDQEGSDGVAAHHLFEADTL